jgi:hypothetical protein
MVDLSKFLINNTSIDDETFYFRVKLDHDHICELMDRFEIELNGKHNDKYLDDILYVSNFNEMTF